MTAAIADGPVIYGASNLANIETSSKNLLNLINDILDLSRIEAGHSEVNVQSVDVRSLAGECAECPGVDREGGVELRREPVHKPASCLGKREQAAQCRFTRRRDGVLQGSTRRRVKLTQINLDLVSDIAPRVVSNQRKSSIDISPYLKS